MYMSREMCICVCVSVWIPPHSLVHTPLSDVPSRSAALCPSTMILRGLCAVAAGSCGSMRINKRKPCAGTKKHML